MLYIVANITFAAAKRIPHHVIYGWDPVIQTYKVSRCAVSPIFIFLPLQVTNFEAAQSNLFTAWNDSTSITKNHDYQDSKQI